LQLKLSFISTGPVSHQLDHLPDHCVNKGDYEIERDRKRKSKGKEYRPIASRTAETPLE